MKILLLGATGPTGIAFTSAAIKAGHEVTALVRDPSRLAARANLTVVKGDARDADPVGRAAIGAEVIVSALGVGKSRKPNDLMVEATRSILSAAGRVGIRRVIVLSAFGIGDSYPAASFLIHLGYRVMSAVFKDKEAGEALLRDSGLDWTIVYSGSLTDGPRTGRLVATDLVDVDRVPGVPRASRADVAEFLLSAATGETWSRRIAVLTTPG